MSVVVVNSQSNCFSVGRRQNEMKIFKWTTKSTEQSSFVTLQLQPDVKKKIDNIAILVTVAITITSTVQNGFSWYGLQKSQL